MSGVVPKILVLGHSFVRRLSESLDAQFDQRASHNFHLPESGYVQLHGSGGRTVDKILLHDLPFVQNFKPDILILEVGTNDLRHSAPEIVGSKIDDLARLFRDKFHVRVVCVCQVINRNVPYASSRTPDHDFNANAARLRHYLSVVLSEEPGIFLWEHREFSKSNRVLLAADGVHCNAKGQYCLYRSYRGAILHALGKL